jgi:excisionase family DNA binding protein
VSDPTPDVERAHDLQMDSMHQLPPTLRPEEAFALLRIGRSLGYRMLADGRLPSLRLGRRIVVPTAPLLRLLEGSES